MSAKWKRWHRVLLTAALASALGVLHVVLASQAEDGKRHPPRADGPSLFAGHGPGPAHPFGRLNPAAPKETAQFAFMIGEFDCVDEIRGPDGQWKTTAAIWNASYFLNGMAIQDHYWNDSFATSNIRVYDAVAGKWKVTYFQMPRYQSGVWEGGQIDDRMVMTQDVPGPDGTPRVTSRLTFHDITPDGYRWVGESMRGPEPATFWKSTCRRRR